MEELRGVDLNLLRALDALLRGASVTRAARDLGITQSAASNALRRLRDHFGDPLLVREGNAMQRTSFAEALRPRVRAASVAMTAALSRPAAFEPGRAEGRVRIATSDHVEQVVIEPLAAALATEAPGLTLFVEPFDDGAPARLRNGALDLIVAPRSRMPPALQARRILEEPFVLVMRQRHPNRPRSRLSRRWYLAQSHVLVAPGGGRSGVVDHLLAQRGEARSIARVVSSFSQALLLVAESDLVTTIPRSFAQRYARRLGLVLAGLPLALPPVRLHAAWAARQDDDPLHAWFRGRLAEMAQR